MLLVIMAMKSPYCTSVTSSPLWEEKRSPHVFSVPGCFSPSKWHFQINQEQQKRGEQGVLPWTVAFHR